MKKSNGIIIVLLILVIIGLSVALVVTNMPDKEAQNQGNIESVGETENVEDKEESEADVEYNLSDYVEIVDQKSMYKENDIKIVKFKKLPLRVTGEFETKQFYFMIGTDGRDYDIENDVKCNVSGNILSIYTEETVKFPVRSTPTFYSCNIDLSKERIVTNEEILKKYNISLEEAYTKILTKMYSTMTVEQLLLDLHGDVSADKISKEEFKNNIDSYAKYLNNRYDIFVIYIEDGKVFAAYNQDTVLNRLGMGSHMGVGLILLEKVQLN